jgi:hypothetical protein
VDEIHPLLTSDGANGAIITWRDARSGLNHNPFAQHVLGTGSVDPAWPVNGRALTTSDGEQVAGAIVGDGAAGAIISWEENSFVFVDHILGNGVVDPTFPVNGQFVRLLLTFQHNPDIVPSGAHDAIVVWSDGASGNDFDIYGQLVQSTIALSVDPADAAGRYRVCARGPQSGVRCRDAAIHAAACGERFARDLRSGRSANT